MAGGAEGLSAERLGPTNAKTCRYVTSAKPPRTGRRADAGRQPVVAMRGMRLPSRPDGRGRCKIPTFALNKREFGGLSNQMRSLV